VSLVCFTAFIITVVEVLAILSRRFDVVLGPALYGYTLLLLNVLLYPIFPWFATDFMFYVSLLGAPLMAIRHMIVVNKAVTDYSTATWKFRLF
jgi:hypothetical protein